MSDLPQNPETQDDLLERLLSGAAERAAKQQVEELTKKGTVTKGEFSAALSEFENRLIEKIDSSFTEKLQKASAQADPEAADPTEPVQKASAGRRSTIQSSTSDPREDNPLRYLLQKSRKGEELDVTDKAIAWGLTLKALTQGMSTAPIEGEDFADEYNQ